jgi:glutathione reductase (NADPH)
MPQYDYDFFVIGAGSGGVRAARMAASYGAKVAIAEERYFGGTCVNVGCIPKKLLVYAAHFAEDFEDAAAYGWTVAPDAFDWATLIANKDKEIARLNGIYKRLLEGNKVAIFEARAMVAGPNEIDVAGRRVTAKYILVAVGGWPVVPEIPGAELAITSNEAFFLDELPKRVVIGGGGYIAVEFAGIFHGLGSQVTQLYRGPLFLRGFDIDVRRTLADEMRKKGTDLRFDSDVARLDKGANGIVATLKDGSKIEADQVLFATGRAPNSASLGLDALGVKRSWNGAIEVDEYFRTAVPSIYALGDVIHRWELTPVAIAEAMVLTGNLFNGLNRVMDYEDIPTAVFSQPPCGVVGLTEEQARERCGEVAIYRSTFTPLKHSVSGRPEKTMMKLIVEKATDRVVGCHMVGPDAGEIVQGLAVALKCGATKAQFDATIGIHPTAAEEFVTMRTPVPEPAPEPARAAE